MLNSHVSFVIELKVEIHLFVPGTQSFLSNIREPSHKFLKFQFEINWLQIQDYFHLNNDTQTHKGIVNKGGYVE